MPATRNGCLDQVRAKKEVGIGTAPETLILSLSKDEGSNTAPAAHPSTGSGWGWVRTLRPSTTSFPTRSGIQRAASAAH